MNREFSTFQELAEFLKTANGTEKFILKIQLINLEAEEVFGKQENNKEEPF